MKEERKRGKDAVGVESSRGTEYAETLSRMSGVYGECYGTAEA